MVAPKLACGDSSSAVSGENGLRQSAKMPRASGQGQWPVYSFCVYCLILICVLTLGSSEEYEGLGPSIEALHPRGLRVSLPDEEGIELFAFHANVNQPLDNVDAGQISVDVTRKSDGRWTYTNPRIRLRVGDVINYWFYVLRDTNLGSRGFQKLHQTYRVHALLSASSTTTNPPPTTTIPSTTVMPQPTPKPSRRCVSVEVCFQEVFPASTPNSG